MLPRSSVRFAPDNSVEWLEQKFGITPFAFLGSNLDSAEPRWMSFLTATVHRNAELIQQRSLRPTWVEKMFLAVSRKLTGRYPFYQKQNSRQTGFHLLLNGLAGGNLWRNLKLLGHAVRPGARLARSGCCFSGPRRWTNPAASSIVECCPDAVLKDGHLVPLCISDLVATEETNSWKATAVPVSSLPCAFYSSCRTRTCTSCAWDRSSGPCAKRR